VDPAQRDPEFVQNPLHQKPLHQNPLHRLFSIGRGTRMRNPANTLLLVIGIAVAIVGVIVANLLPRLYTDMFESFGAELPALTRLFVHGGGFLWVLPLLVPVLSSFVRVRTPDDKRRGIVALLLGVAVGFATPMVCVLSMYLPIFGLAAGVDS